jgi:NAD(P)-dependent dehydrogenase (short-subunit alcohol dehydrogenase family)
MTLTLITGANKGLGHETCQLIMAGHTVYIGARDTGRGQAAARELGARFVRLDVTDQASVDAAAAAVAEAEGHLDVLVNNAGSAAGTCPRRRSTPRRSSAYSPDRPVRQGAGEHQGQRR